MIWVDYEKFPAQKISQLEKIKNFKKKEFQRVIFRKWKLHKKLKRRGKILNNPMRG